LRRLLILPCCLGLIGGSEVVTAIPQALGALLRRLMIHHCCSPPGYFISSELVLQPPQTPEAHPSHRLLILLLTAACGYLVGGSEFIATTVAKAHL
jgi:hypothetical protein